MSNKFYSTPSSSLHDGHHTLRACLKPFTYQDPKTGSRNGAALALKLLSIGANRSISSIPPIMPFHLPIGFGGGCTMPSAEGVPMMNRKEVKRG